jgi:hypothetical protein
MGQKEPPSIQLAPSLFMIGKDSHGHWVVQDQKALHGGLFVDRAQALKFALFENGNHPQAVVMVPGVLELNMTGKTQPAHASHQSNTPLHRHAA